MAPKEDASAAKADTTTNNNNTDNNITVTVNVDDFSRTRDRVVYTLAALQSAVADLQRAFVNHADTILSMGGVKTNTNASLLTVPSLNGILEAGAAAGALPGAKDAAALAAASSDSEEPEKNKKKKRKHDPNAPKRPLTPYFLYMQQNRMKIAEEMPEDKRPQDVSNEGTRRWQAMTEEERSVYAKQYLQNLEVYRAKMEAYKAGRPVPDDAAVAADLQLQKDVERDVETAAAAAEAAKPPKAKATKGGKAGAASSSDSSSSDDDDDSSSSDDSEEQQTTTKRRRRTAKEIAADKEKEKKKSATRSATAAAAAAASETPSKTPKSAEKVPKKRKRKSEVAAAE